MATDPPPRWHSAVKTLRPRVAVDTVLAAMSSHEHGTVADSFGDLDLGAHGFTLLIEAVWLYRAPDPRPQAGVPPGWSVVADPRLLIEWNRAHDTEGVLLPSMLTDPRFTVLALAERGALAAGAVLHDTGSAVGVSNTWSHDVPLEWEPLLAAVASVHPGQPLVDYAADTAPNVRAGFEPVGPQRVWER
jgi:hypothetical protein